MYETNSIIKASAGTGKTFALATRFIRLILLEGVKSETIIALTFSRAAAQEIYTKILERLYLASQSEEGAAKEWENLLEDFRKNEIKDGKEKYAAILQNPPPHGAADFTRILRELLSSQHLGTIATIDSFILRIVRNFPKEMGFQNAVKVLDEFEESLAIDDAIKSALNGTNENTASMIAGSFFEAKKGEFSRTCLSAISDILSKQGWRNFVIAHPEAKNWTKEWMCNALKVELESVCPDLSEFPFCEIARKNTISPEEKLIEKIKRYDPAEAPDFLIGEGAVGQIARHFWENPDSLSFTYEYYEKEYTINCRAEDAKNLHDAIRYVIDKYLGFQLEVVLAKIRLAVAVESEYGKLTRQIGRLTFSDFTEFPAKKTFASRGIALKNIEFRFDSKFDHWALDEFQDTSELQWKCLNELVRNAALDGRNREKRSAMVVGDMKQSIYTWRGASARPFEDVASWPEFEGAARDFKRSHRYGPKITEFVNKVFSCENIKLEGIIPEACKGAVETWREGWADHVSKEREDYVKVIEAEEAKDDESDEFMLKELYAELEPLWAEHEKTQSEETVGILVRNNDDGLKVAEYLRARGLKVVWEGMNPVTDDPVVYAVLSLLKLADHPEDTLAMRLVSELIDIKDVIMSERSDAAAISKAVSESISHLGFARTLKDYCTKLIECGKFSRDSLTAEKLARLTDFAVTYENRVACDGRVDSFLAFVEESFSRSIAVSPQVIRILTIHRSKGLGIDHVFVPVFEKNRSRSAIDIPKSTMPLYCGEDWVLTHLKKGVERFNKKTHAAYERMRSEKFAEALRTYYVALTRAKKSMFVFLRKLKDGKEAEADKPQNGLQMRDLIAEGLKGELPYERGVRPSFAFEGEERSKAKPRREAWGNEEKSEELEHSSPSTAAIKDLVNHSAGNLFVKDELRAAEKGKEAHEAFASIEWGDKEPFLKPSEDAEVWREKNYELYLPSEDGGAWQTGQFDRVVFYGNNGVRCAKIYDFKTNRKRAGESEEAFERRMKKTYLPQLASYRTALAHLSAIAEENIDIALYLTATSKLLEL